MNQDVLSPTAAEVEAPPVVSTTLHVRGVVRSELLKMKAVRSSCALPIVAVTLMWLTAIGFAFTQASTKPGELTQDNFASIPSSGSLVAGILMAAAAITLSVSEFRTQSISISLLAVPSRRLLFLGKAIVVTAVGATAGVVSAFGGLLFGLLILAGDGSELDLGNPTLWVNVFGAVAIFIALSWMGFALAMVTRSTMVSMMLVFAGIFGPPIIEAVGIGLDWQWLRQAAHLLPGLLLGTATTTIASPDTTPAWMPSPFVAGVLLLVWGLLFLTVAASLFKKR
jgi:ABC-type transport system involved in multi-copper enzyme maturation permease subunit